MTVRDSDMWHHANPNPKFENKNKIKIVKSIIRNSNSFASMYILTTFLLAII